MKDNNLNHTNTNIIGQIYKTFMTQRNLSQLVLFELYAIVNDKNASD